MMNKLLFGLIVSLALVRPALSQQNTTPSEEKGPYLGVLFSPVPEALLDHLPFLPREGGVLITHILPDSPAATAGVKKHDILLVYNGEKVRDGNHLVRLIQNGKSGQVVRLELLRGGRETSLEVKLALGPMLKVAREEKQPPGVAKPGPPAVSVTAVPMDGNRLQITFEYSELGRIKRVTCAGKPDEIEREIDKLPRRVQSLARVAVLKLREFNLPVGENTPRPR